MECLRMLCLLAGVFLFTACGTYVASYSIVLSEVESPADSKQQFGETKVVGFNEEGVDKYRYEDDYIDIIGCDVYNSSESSNLSAMLKSDAITLNKRMLALSECCFIPDPDIMARDNAVWLWAAPWNGKYLINEYGELSGDYITVSQLKKVYNHELTIARDELPDFS